MEIQKYTKEAFAVIGKEGSTENGAGFIQNLWKEANAHFDEIAHLAKKTADGKPAGFWGAMTDFSRTFKPWEDNFSKGLYLAGAEAPLDVLAPKGWIKWTIPAYEYLRVKTEGDDTFPKTIQYLKEQNITLAGAVHDFTDSATGENYMYFPIKRIDAAAQIDTYCGLSCASCEFKTSMNCGGCISTKGNPFHTKGGTPCAIAECVKAKQAAGGDLTFCGECDKTPCETLKSYSNDSEHGDNPKGARIERCQKLKKAKVAEARKGLSNSTAVCGMSCDHCFLGEWCGGCRVEYNCCSYGTLFKENKCPNIVCAAEHGFTSAEQGCYNCPELESCKTGFFDGNHGLDAKIAAILVKKHGFDAGKAILNKMEQAGCNIKETFEQFTSVEDAIKKLESYL